MDGKKYQDSKKSQVDLHPNQKVQNKMSNTNENQKDVFSVYTKSFDKGREIGRASCRERV